VTKLIRLDHDYDRDSTVKHKDVNYIIKGIECPEYQIKENGQCWTCAELIKNGRRGSDLKWYQDGICTQECNYADGYGIYNEKLFVCKKCDERTDAYGNGRLICSCLIGTVKSFEDDICYLPEMNEITKLTDEQRNAQCFKRDGKTHNYCYNNYTRDCVIESVNGYFFPTCICKEGYSGKYCEYKENEINLDKNMKDILDNVSEFNLTYITVTSKIRSISYFLEIDGNEYMKKIDNTHVTTYIDESIKIVKDVVDSNKTTVTQVFDLLELALYFLNYRIKQGSNLRSLQDLEDDESKLKYLLDNLHYMNVKANSNSTSNYNIQSDKLYLSTFITYKKDDLEDESFKLELANSKNFKVMEYLNISVTDENTLIFVTLINNTLYGDNQVNDNGFGVTGFFSTKDDLDKNTLQFKYQENFIFYISSSFINFNFHLAEYYNSKNIKIYDKNDQAFTDPCFLSEYFDFDLTQKFRKNNVFQKVNYGNNVCKYISFDYKYKRLNFLCNNFSSIDKINNLNYGKIVFNIQKESIEDADKVYNLPTKCTSKINNIGSNWGFWFFLFICVIELLYCIGIGILTFGSLRLISFRKGLVQDELYKVNPYKKHNESDEDYESNSVYIPKNNEKMKKSNKRKIKEIDDNFDNNTVISVKEEIFNRDLKSCILYNFKELHPLATLCRVSVISPLILNSIFFVFNTLVLFGFNALIYYESLIEKRIFDKKRNNFDYPMRKEFHKIILSILCQIALSVIFKIILLVTLKQRNHLKESLSDSSLKKHETINNVISEKVRLFQEEMFLRRIISSSLMVVIIVFFFYYSVAFCGVYIQTQRNWFFSGIWSLFWNWVIFAPIYIIVISIIEHKKQDLNDSTVYYMKRLFFF
jgi:hypothetical protein